MVRASLATSITALLTACTLEPWTYAARDGSVDASVPDASLRDAGAADAGAAPDSGRDASAPDAARPDAAARDAGAADAGVMDASAIDSGGACPPPPSVSRITYLASTDETAFSSSMATRDLAIVTPRPSGADLATGDVMIATVIATGTASIAGPASGWNEVDVPVGTNGLSITQRTFWRRAVCPEPVAYLWRVTLGPRQSARGTIYAYRGVTATGSPIATHSFAYARDASGAIASTTIPGASVDLPAGALVFGTYTASAVYATATITRPAGTTFRRLVGTRFDGSSTDAESLVTVYLEQLFASAGPSGPLDATVDRAVLNLSHLVALRPP